MWLLILVCFVHSDFSYFLLVPHGFSVIHFVSSLSCLGGHLIPSISLLSWKLTL